MKRSKLVMGLSVAAFFLMILFPLWGLVFPQPVEESLEENRSMTEWSFSGSLKDRIQTAENFLNDHLAFRQTAISAVLRANLDLGESPHAAVLSGFDGWLYYLEGDEDFRRSGGLDKEFIVNLYQVQQSTTDVFAAAGVDYRILVAPDKHTVYPRYLPLSSRMGSGVSALDQMMVPPGPGYTVRFVDVRPALIAAAEKGDLQQYYKTDSHWSSNGAFTAYQVLMEQLLPEHPTLHVLTEDDLYRQTVDNSGDLAAMIGQKGIREDHLELLEVRNPTYRDAPELGSSNMTAYVNETIPDAPRILLIHDSFGPSLVTYLRESASVLYTMSNDAPSFSSIGDLSRFDIVIYEVVERNRTWLWGGIQENYRSEDDEGGEEDYDSEYEEE